MKTKSQFIKNWVKKGGNLKGDEWILLPKNKNKYSPRDIQNLQADEVNVVALVGSFRNGRKAKICTVAELEQQESKQLWLQQQIEEAKKKLYAAVQVKADNPIVVDRFSLPISNLIRKFKENYVIGLDDAANYQFILDLWEAAIGHLPVDQVDPIHCEQFKIDQLKRSPNRTASKNKTLSPKTVNNYLSVMSKCFQWGQLAANKWVKPGNNPVKLIEWPINRKNKAPERSEVVHRGTDQLAALSEQLNLSKSRDLKDFVFFCLITGVRQGEGYGLTWDNVHFEEDFIRIAQALRSRVPDGIDENGRFIYKKNKNGKLRVITKGLKNGDDYRDIPLDKYPSLKKLLIKRKAAAAERQLAGGKAEDRVFPQDVDYAWHTVLKKSGIRKADAGNKIDDFVFHCLRHSAATWQVQDGVPLFNVSKFLGHNDLQSVNRYAHWDKSQHERSAAVAESAVTAALGAI
jgi:integrase